MGSKSKAALSKFERRIVKRLLSDGHRNQDIQALINFGRSATINFARISEVKKDNSQEAASDEEVEFFHLKNKAYDPRTGLNHFEDEKIIRAREAMLLAVQVFNNPILKFRTEVFSVLAVISWTYLLQVYYLREGQSINRGDGKTQPLSQLIERQSCPLTEGMRNNLRAIIEIREKVEHKLLGRGDHVWESLFQACCLNFENVLREQFGDRLSLAEELPFALQFRKLSMEQATALGKYGIPEGIEALDARLSDQVTPEQEEDIEYKFRVIYTQTAASKSQAHFQFVSPESKEGKEIRNIVAKRVVSDHMYPFRPMKVCQLVRERINGNFSIRDHTLAWQSKCVRPRQGCKDPENTDRRFCIYHPAHGDYTYSEEWVDHLVKEFGQ